ncbi:MAG: DUF309 domain-containing protein [Sulfurimonas sp.]|uniref:DUF309 domain-containing protein n=1 Tax=Sulfurimonas sp. TaxID=2022749 RepID=UPI002631DDE7|nr:DUF309 domain-containing protein [Sulfurimonas sp.]MDD2651906.1 DUF309 domain-containing protein [Sulfurimonas sp.]MDD3451777.1 DUF309 domain-containing protein [Sulfurimonas sp.]
MSEYKKYLDSFLKNLKNENFYEAHEDLEAIWFPRRFEQSDEVKLLKGLINASVSFELRKKGKIEQAKKVWQTYLKYKELINSINSPNQEIYHLIIQEIQSIREA